MKRFILAACLTLSCTAFAANDNNNGRPFECGDPNPFGDIICLIDGIDGVDGNVIRSEFAAADDVVRDEFQASDDVVRNEFQAADAGIQDSLNALEQEIIEVNREDMRVKSGVVNDDTLTLRVEDQTKSRGRNFIFGRDVDIDVSSLNQSDEVVALDSRVTNNEIAISDLQGSIQGDFEAADDVVRGEFAAGDAAVLAQSDVNDRRVLAAAQQADNVVRNEFAAEDINIRNEFAAADNVVRNEFAVADNVVRNEFAAEDINIRNEFVAGDNVVRNEFAAGDAEVLAKSDAGDAALSEQIVEGDDAVRNEFRAADNQISQAIVDGDAAVRAELQSQRADVANAFAATNSRIDDIEAQQRQVDLMLDRQRNEYRGGIAAATALGMIQQAPNAEGLQLSVGVGHFAGETAGSLVLGGKVAERVYVNAGVTYGAERTYGASMTYRFGET